MGLESHRAASPARVRFALITISDTRERATDRGGAYLREALEAAGQTVAHTAIVRDEAEEIRSAVRAAVDAADVDLVLTTGGTGIAPRDVTYDALKALLDSEIPGFGELFRLLSEREIGPAAMLSRAIGGLCAGKVVLALPGSPKALKLAVERIILPEAGHLVSQTRGAG